MNINIKNWIFYISGIGILAFGVTLMLLSNLGAGGWDALCGNASKLFGITVGNCVIILGVFLVAMAAIISKDKPNLYSFLVSLLTGKFIDLWYYIVFRGLYFETLYIKIIVVLLGTVLIAAGCAFIFVTPLPKNHTETFVFAVVNKVNKPYKIIKTIADTSALIIAIIFAIILKDYSNFGIGTITNTFFTGYLIYYMMPVVEKIYLGNILKNKKCIF